MKRWIVGTALGLALAAQTGPSRAETFTSAGQPFCTKVEELQEFLLAAMQHDQRWLQSLHSCLPAPAGTKVAIIEHLPSDSEIGHVVRVRIITKSGASAVGYTLNLGLKETP